MQFKQVLISAFGIALLFVLGIVAWEFVLAERFEPGSTAPPHLHHILVVSFFAALVATVMTVVLSRGIARNRREAQRLKLENDQRRRVEDALETSEQALNQAQRVAKLAHWRWSFANQRLTTWSGEFPEVFGRSSEDVDPEDQGQFAWVHPDDRDRLAAVYDAATPENPGFDVQYRIIHGDGTTRYVREVGEPETAADGTVIAHFGIIQDITEQRQAEEALRGNEARFRDFAMSSADRFWEMDAELRFAWLHDAERIPRPRRVDTYLGKTRWEAAGADPDQDPFWRAHRADLQARRPFKNFEYRNDLGPSGTVWWRASGVPLFDADGKFVGYRGTSTEITQQKSIEAQRDQALAEATRANEAKSAFLANVSHETRTPMHGVLAMADALLRGNLTPEQRQQVEGIKDSGAALHELLDDILDLSKVEAGKLSLEPIDFSLHALIKSVENFWRSQEKAGDLVFTVDCDLEGMDWIHADRTRLRQVLLNLLGNAFKFTMRGDIRLRLSRSDVDKHLLTFTISDTGIGITEAQIEDLFTPFQQADASITRRFGGTGLGLAISKQLVALMGGEIGVSSEPGKGSTFWFSIPVRPALPQDTTAPRQAPDPLDMTLQTGRTLRVLAAEDNHINQVALKVLFEPLGWAIDIVDNGAQALAAIQSESYDVIIMDAQMPEMDGITATRKIRALPGPAAQVPIIAVTAHAMTGDREKYLASGMTDYLSKPFDAQDLISAILRCCGAGEPHQPAASPHKLSGKRG